MHLSGSGRADGGTMRHKRREADMAELPPEIDTSRPHSARMYDYFIGGENHFAADRKTAREVLRHSPFVPTAARENRAFLGRAVRYLVAEAGVTQFLDIGTGLPTTNNVHEVAQRVAPSARVVYVDNDPLVLTHARALLVGSTQGATDYIDADARDVDTILSGAAATLDFSRPVAITMLGILPFIGDDAVAAGIVHKLLS